MGENGLCAEGTKPKGSWLDLHGVVRRYLGDQAAGARSRLRTSKRVVRLRGLVSGRSPTPPPSAARPPPGIPGDSSRSRAFTIASCPQDRPERLRVPDRVT